MRPASIAPGDKQTFTYQAKVPDTFEGESGTGGCDTGFFPISNTATLEGVAGGGGVTVCVQAAPEFTMRRRGRPDRDPGQEITYTITVKNTGSAGGAATFVDDFDDRLDPRMSRPNPAGGSCLEAATARAVDV